MSVQRSMRHVRGGVRCGVWPDMRNGTRLGARRGVRRCERNGSRHRVSCCEKFGRAGYSLIEVVLALALLVIGITALTSLTNYGQTSALIAEELTAAQIACQTRTNELLSGVRIITPTSNEPVPGLQHWFLSVELQPTNKNGLTLIRTVVNRERLPNDTRARRAGAEHYELVCWVNSDRVSQMSETNATGYGIGNGITNGLDGNALALDGMPFAQTSTGMSDQTSGAAPLQIPFDDLMSQTAQISATTGTTAGTQNGSRTQNRNVRQRNTSTNTSSNVSSNDPSVNPSNMGTSDTGTAAGGTLTANGSDSGSNTLPSAASTGNLGAASENSAINGASNTATVTSSAASNGAAIGSTTPNNSEEAAPLGIPDEDGIVTGTPGASSQQGGGTL